MSILLNKKLQLSIGILMCDSFLDPERTRKDIYDRYNGDVDKLYMDFLRQDSRVNFTFKTFDCAYKMEFPSEQSLIDGEFDGFVITGSKWSVYEKFPWIEELGNFCRKIGQFYPKTKLLGICFGHQMIGQAFEGVVQRVGWNLSHVTIEIDPNYHKQLTSFYQSFPEKIRLLCVHQDQVVVPPPGFTIWSTNDFCRVQGLARGDNILSVQAHPEFDSWFMTDIITNREIIFEPELYERSLKTVNNETDNHLIAQWFVDFLSGVDVTQSAH